MREMWGYFGKKKRLWWQCKGQLLLFLQPFYLKLQIITKRWNNRECGGHAITCESNRRVVFIFLIRKFQPGQYRVWIRILPDWPISSRQRLLFKGMWSFWRLEKDSASSRDMSPIIAGLPLQEKKGIMTLSKCQGRQKMTLPSSVIS